MYVCEFFLTFCFEIISYLKKSCKNTTKKKTTRISFTLVLCCALLLSLVRLFATPWAVPCQAPLSMGILQARLLEWGGLPDPGIEPGSLMSPELAGGFFTTKATWEALVEYGVF